MAEPYDPFAYKELHHLEGLMLADKGQAPRLLEEGFWDRDTLTGIPASPSGGLLGVGNPIAAAGHDEMRRGLLAATGRGWPPPGEA